MQTNHTVADTRGMEREEWLKLRKNGIGGSDASAILGLNPYATPLSVYRDKIGEGKEKDDNEAMRQGRDLEGYVAQRFAEDTGKRVRKCNRILRHPEYPWMLANIDRDIVKEDAGLECKTTSPYSKFNFEEGEINPHYYWQSMHYMAVTGAEKWYVAIMVLGKAFHIFEIERNEDEIARLIEAEREFWEEHVIPRVPPLPTGSESDDETIAEMFPNATEEEVMPIYDMEDALNLRALKQAEKDALEKEIKGIDQTIKLAMGNAEKAQSTRWKINWTNTVSNRVDTKLLKEKYPQIAKEVITSTTSRRFSVTKMKEQRTND